MKKPQDFDLKDWLCSTAVRGVSVRLRSGEHGPVCYWELFPDIGRTRLVRADRVADLVRFTPRETVLLRPTDAVRAEVQKYREFVRTEAAELAEYERLKKKFGGTA